MMPYVAVLFFALFQLLGGVSIGAGLRQLLAAIRDADAEARAAALSPALRSLFFGVLSGGIVTAVSALAFAASARPLFLAGLAVLLSAILGSALLPRSVLQELGAGTLAGIGIGLLVVPMAVLVAIEGFRNGDPVFGLIWGGCAGFVGLVFLLSGLQALLSGKALVLRQTAPGSYTVMSAADADAAAHADSDQAGENLPDGSSPSPSDKPARPHLP